MLIPVEPEQRGYLNGKTTPYSAMENPSTVDVPPLPATVLWYQTLSRLFSYLRHPGATVTDPLTHN